MSVWCRANRFLHPEVTRHGRALSRIFGWKKAPGNDTYKRYFAKFSQRMNQTIFDHFYRWFFFQLRFDQFTLDFVMLAYNLMSLLRSQIYRQFIMNRRTQHTLSTLRYWTFSIGTYLVPELITSEKEGNTTVLKLSLVLKRREWFSELRSKLKQFELQVQFSNA